MKKLIFILLIAIIVCEVTEEELLLKESAGLLQDLINKIVNAGKSAQLKDTLKRLGKAAAAAECCSLFPALSGFCAAAVTMLK